jgi:hypothetical protein
MLPMPLPGRGQAHARTLLRCVEHIPYRVRAWACPRPGGEERGIPTIRNLTPIGRTLAVALVLFSRRRPGKLLNCSSLYRG